MQIPQPSPVFASGKIILLGEHAVVYGYPALCSSISQGVSISFVKGEGRVLFPSFRSMTQKASVMLPSINDHQDLTRNLTHQPGSFLEHQPGSFLELSVDHPFHLAYQAILVALSAQFPISHESFLWDFWVDFQIPVGAGLGSSAAFSVALVKAIAQSFSLSLTKEKIFALAQTAEQIFHGQSSGIDAALATWGGMGIFQKEKPFQKVVVPSFSICIANSNEPKATKSTVQQVARRLQESPAEIQSHLKKMGDLVWQGLHALQKNDLARFGQLMNQNQEKLRHLEVSTPLLDQLCNLALQAGAFGAKLTGGGGGGCVIALAPSKEVQVQTIWKDAGFSSFIITLGGE